jgi:hypothetical protein
VANYTGTLNLIRAVRELRRDEERLSLTFQSLAEQPAERREQFRHEVAELNERAVRLSVAFDMLAQGMFASA